MDFLAVYHSVIPLMRWHTTTDFHCYSC